ncbi:MAG: ATP-binding protein, partial [Myxococcota bacterium]
MPESSPPADIERELARLRGAVDQIADQLCWAVDGRLDFAVRASCADDTVEKLAMLVNFLLDAARRAVEAVEERNHRLVELDRAKARFFANVSHELRTPLTLIQGPVESLLARAREEGDTAAIESLRRVRRNADRLAGVVEDLLAASRLEAGAERVSLRPTDPAGIVRGVVDDAQESARARGVSLTLDVQPCGEPVALDPDKFEKIVLNLVSNALKFTPAGGSVAVSVERYGDTLGLRVADTGPGIRPEDQARLFQRFFQVDASSTRRHDGTGLGLAIVREFAELMGGTAGVESAPGRGSTFWVELPAREIVGATPSAPAVRASALLPPPPPPAPAAVVADGRARIVVAEDNPDLLAYLIELLAPSYSVHPARNGLEALDLVRKLRPSLLLSDVMMPGLDGLELTRRVKADPEL